MSKVHNLYEYSFAKKVCADVPKIINILNTIQSSLYEYQEYKDVADIMYAINDAKIMLDIHYKTYKPILDGKGKKKSEKKS